MNPDDVIPPTSLSTASVIVDALLDGERVDRQALRDALEDRAAREYFVDALVLRQLTHEMAPMTFVAPGSTHAGPKRWLISAAALVLVATGGYVAGHRRDASASTIDSSTAPAAVMTAPAPTKVIRLEPGVSWTTETTRP
ncbi:MAG: hypothetical protein ABI634_20325 [Acidobacteriota bacterium]